jgi:spore coat protein H
LTTPDTTRTSRLLVAMLAALLLLAGCQTGGGADEDGVGGGTADSDPPYAPEVLHLTVDEDVLTELYSREIFSDERVDGTIVRDATGEELAVDGLRFRGASSRGLPKKSFNIRFEEDQPFLFGSNRMNLKAVFTDPTMMRETLAMDMWHALDRPAPRTAYVDLTINGVYEGLYIHVERIDGDLLDHHGLDPDGTLVRDELRADADVEIAPSAFGLDVGDDREALVETLEENFNSRGDPDWGAVAELITDVARTPPGPRFAALVEERVDLDVLLDWLAIHELTGDADSYGDDYWLYLDHDDPDARWIVIPWDKDLTFGSYSRETGGTLNDFFAYEHDIQTAATLWGNRLVTGVYETPELRERLTERTLELADRVFTGEWFDERITAIAGGIRESVTTGPGPGRFALHRQNHHGQLGRFDQHLEVLRDYVELRWALLRHRMAGEGAGGAAGAASATIDEGHAGERILLTDGTGFTVAALTLESVEGSGELSVEVQPLVPAEGAVAADGIDRVWRIRTTVPVVSGQLDLYYRNDVGYPGGFPDENWYPGGEAVGRQGELVATRLADDVVAPFPTRVNPFSNKASFDLELTRGVHTFGLLLPEFGGRWVEDDGGD